MIASILHELVAAPWIYDLVQYVAGAKLSQRRLEAQVAAFSDARLILDVGGGTGVWRRLWPVSCRYICLDIDLLKLEGFRQKYSTDEVLLADATRIPMTSSSVDVVTCIGVTHHIPDNLLSPLMVEISRVLKPSGRFVFLDSVRDAGRWTGRLIQKYDRGAHPRSAQQLMQILSDHYYITHVETYVIHLQYLLCLGTKRSHT